jgi:hypothetical protein
MSTALPPTAEHGQHVLPHDWPATIDELTRLAGCRSCGRATLRLFIESAKWVGRRVERIEFLDDRTVRRRVSVSYVVPEMGCVLQRGSGTHRFRLLPIAALRRKSLINFHFTDQDNQAVPVIGLRENQAITMALVTDWALRALEANGRDSAEVTAKFTFESPAYGVIRDIIEGDQEELNNAWTILESLRTGSAKDGELLAGLDSADQRVLECLTADACFSMVLKRLAENWLLFVPDGGIPGEHRVVKFSYDEPLTARYSAAGYSPHKPGNGTVTPPHYQSGKRRKWRKDLLAGLGLRAALVRFPVPGAELASSYHVEIATPPGASIVEASLLAGLPNLYGDPHDNNPQVDRQFYELGYAQSRIHPRRRRRRPSFDFAGPGYATIDLHVADVPYGSLSRAQVLLRARPQGWVATSAACSWAVLIALSATGRSKLDHGIAATLLITLAAAIVALVVHEDEHRMVTRLLGLLKLVSAASVALIVIAALAAVTFDDHYSFVVVCAWVSVAPVAMTTLAWALSTYSLRDLGGRDLDRRLLRWLARRNTSESTPSAESVTAWLLALRHPARVIAVAAQRTIEHQMFIRESPWEQYPLGGGADLESSEIAEERREQQRSFAARLDAADFPYDVAVEKLRFDRPAIRVASAEGSRMDFTWNVANRTEFMHRLRT